MVMLVRIAKWPFLFEQNGYWTYKNWTYKSRCKLVFAKVSVYDRNHDECLSRLVEW